LGRTGARTSDQPFLIFWFFFIKEKEKAKGQSPIKFFCILNAYRIISLCPFFCLIKRTKNQAFRIASGRHSALHAWVVAFPAL